MLKVNNKNTRTTPLTIINDCHFCLRKALDRFRAMTITRGSLRRKPPTRNE